MTRRLRDRVTDRVATLALGIALGLLDRVDTHYANAPHDKDTR